MNHIESKRFTVYKVSIDGNQSKRDFRYNQSLDDINNLPTGKQKDEAGYFVYQYGINAGVIL